MAISAVTGEYVVAWSGDTNTGGQVDNEYEVFAQRLTAAGALTGPAVRVSHTGVDGDTAAAALTPAVAVDGTTGQALVAWSGDPGTGGLADDEFEIFTQRLSGAGALVGAAARVSHMGPDGNPADDAVTPDVTWNAPARQYLVSWTGTPGTGGLADGESELYVQRLLSDGSEYGPDDVRVSVMGPDGDPVYGVGRGTVASGGDVPSFLAVWDGTDDTGGLVAGEFEIHSRLLAVDPTAPTDPTLTGGSSAWQNTASVTVTASGATDPQSGVSGYEHRVSTDGGAIWSGPAAGTAVTVAAEGEALVEFRAVNGNGDQGGWVRATVRIDRTTPPAPTTGGGSAAWQSVASLTITGNAPAEPSGLTYEHRLSTDGGGTWSAPATGAPVTVSAEGQTLVQFRAVDGAGNTGGWSASETARIDRTAPTDPTVSGGSPAWQNVASVTVTAGGSTDAGGSGLTGYQSRVSTDGGVTWSAPATGAVTTPSAEGETLVQARAVDGAGNLSGWVQATVRIDRGAPAAPTGLSGPAATNAPPALTWNATADAVSYVITRDGTQIGTATGTAFTDPALPADGTHAYRVIAVDGAGNSSAPSAALNVDVDTVAPAIPGGVAGGSLAWSNAASTTITATPAGGTTLQNRLSTDGGTSWGAASAGASVTVAAEGETLVQFRAVDAAGNPSGWTTVSAASTVRLDRTAPATPTGLTGAGVTATAPVLGWGAAAGADGYRVTRNGTQIGTTTGTAYTDTSLPAGGFFTYRVIATDLAGNASAPSAAIGVTYTPSDVIPPDTAITGAPAGPVNTASLTLGLTATESSTYECNVDGAGWSACGTPWAVGPLADGTHTLAARARDLAGNTDPSPAQVTLTIDTAAPPVPTLTATADASVPLNSATGQVQLVTTTSGDAVRVVVTEGARVAYDGPAGTVTDGGLTDGAVHAYSAVAYDAAGNASAAVTASATTPDRTPPARPAAPGGSGSPLALTWTPVAGASG
ncbi:MAG: hypothetical protein U0Y82_05115 [Thermoleophilia bacterium]